MNILLLQLLIIVGLITGFIVSHIKLQQTPATIKSKSLVSYWLGR